MIRLQRRLYISLIEIMIVLTIISITGGVIGIKSYHALREQRFRTEVSLIVDQLRLAQDLMLVLKGDVTFIVEQKEKDIIEHKLICEQPLAGRWKQEIERKHPNLKTATAIGYEDALKLPTEANKISLSFLSNGSVMPHGILRLASAEKQYVEGTLERFVIFYGYPHPIKAISAVPDDYDDNIEKEKASNQLLTQRMMEEIHEKQ